MIETLVYSPFFGLLLCIFTYLLGRWLQNKTHWTLANPLVDYLLCHSAASNAV